MKRHLPTLFFVVCLFLAFAVYFPGLSGYFMFDDNINIVENTSIRIQTLDWYSLKKAALSGGAGPFGRPISVLSFALDYYNTGLDPYYLKLTNVVIHLLNGAAVFMLSYLLIKAHHQRMATSSTRYAAQWIAAVISAAWMLHPLNLTGVLYIVQRMTSLASLFTLLGMSSYTFGRLYEVQGRSGWTWIIISFLIFVPLATFSKENGALLPAFLLLIECIFFRFQTSSASARRTLSTLHLICVVIPVIAVLGYTLYSSDWITKAYQVRDFNLTERVLTEARVVWLYMRLILVPDITLLGMYHDDIAVSKGLLEPVSTSFALAGIVLLLGFAAWSVKRYPIAAFGILFFFLGHSMESSVFALEIAHEHRNYLPAFGLLFALFYQLLATEWDPQSLPTRRVVCGLLLVFFAGLTLLRASQWGDAVTMKEKEAQHHPNSVRANMDVGAFYASMPASSQIEADEFYNNAYTYYAKASSISPSDTLGLFGLITLHEKYKLPLEESWTPVLAKRIEKYPFAPSTGNSLVGLQRCVLSRNCPNVANTLETLFQAALRNPSMLGKARSQVLFAWSDYLYQMRHERDNAMKAAYQASQIIPGDLDAQLTLVRLLETMGHSTNARAELDRVRKMDVTHLHTDEIDELEKLVAR